QAGFEAEEREREIELLEAGQALQQAELERQRDSHRALVFGFVLTLGVAILLFNWHRLRTRAASMAEAVERERTVSAGLREIDQLKDEFLANTSHELRTPLYGMTGLVEALLEESSEVGPDARVVLNTVLQSGRRLNRLVGEVLDFSKLQHEGFELFIEPVDLRSLADIVLTLSGPLAAGSKLELLNSIDPDLPPAGADQARVEQVLHNLVGNAIKFTERGRVEVSAHLDGA
ncbi:MAG: guanylate cyclase, partial [bacterium]|nr:guanylate cyclase [bacterium]